MRLVGTAKILKLWSLPGSAKDRVLNLVASVVSGRRIRIKWSDLKIANPEKIQIGDDFSAGRSLWLESVEGLGQIIIGDHVRISDYVHIGSVHLVEIGEGTLIGSKVLITDHSHGEVGERGVGDLALRPNDRPLRCKGPVAIGRSVWIGDGVCILSGVRIGDRAVIGANSVVVRDVAPDSVCVGVPARQIWPRVPE